MTEAEESVYMRGERAVYRQLLGVALRGLSVDDAPDDLAAAHLRIARLEAHLADARAGLRSLCDDFGDNDWGDDLYLADAIDKHLGRHLHGEDVDARDDVWRRFGSYLEDGGLSREDFERMWPEDGAP